MNTQFNTRWVSAVSVGEMMDMMGDEQYLVEFIGDEIIQEVEYDRYKDVNIEITEMNSDVGLAIGDKVVYKWDDYDLGIGDSFTVIAEKIKITRSVLTYDDEESIKLAKANLLREVVDDFVNDSNLYMDDSFNLDISYHKIDNPIEGAIKLRVELIFKD